jgi:hypothetical protein
MYLKLSRGYRSMNEAKYANYVSYPSTPIRRLLMFRVEKAMSPVCIRAILNPEYKPLRTPSFYLIVEKLFIIFW